MLGCACSLASAQACDLSQADWRSLPQFSARMDQGGVLAQARGLQQPSAQIWGPDAQGGYALPLGEPLALQRGNYHWLSVSGSWQDCPVQLATVHYVSKPDKSPSDLLKRVKADLELVPERLPREHWRYRGGESWPFVVRWQGRPLVHAEVLFVDSQGARFHGRSDDEGRVMIAFPDFIPDEMSDPPAAHGRRPSRSFALWVTAPNGSQLAGFAYRYAPNAAYQHDLPWGAVLALAGMLLAAGWLVRRKPAKKRRAVTEQGEG